MPSPEALVVVICGDLGAGPVPLRIGELAAQLRRELSGTAPLLLPEICEAPQALVDALAAIEPKRVVVGCRAGSQRRRELLACLRRAGTNAAGIEIVDLRTADDCPEKVALEQSVALLSAAVARVNGADLDAPVKERTSLSSGGVSRRSLLRGVNTARRFVAVWRPDRCTGGVACTACLLSCPRGALRRDAGRVAVDGDRCNGCGVCVSACQSGAFALPGTGMESLSAAAGVLVAAIRRHGAATGIAIACQHTKSLAQLGEPWLVLRVPSIEMLSAGWLLQLVAAGVGVRVLSCEEDACATRIVDLDDFVRELGGALGFSTGGEALGRRTVSGPCGVPIQLREPEATMEALEALGALGALGADRRPWRAEGRGCPLGVVRIDAAGCSLCGVCASNCPTGALQTERRVDGLVRLSVDSGRCTACEACVNSCPEAVITLERAVDGAVLAAGRQMVATGSAGVCERCGAPVAAGLSQAALFRRLGESHPNLTSGSTTICADCRLGGRSVTVAPPRRAVP